MLFDISGAQIISIPHKEDYDRWVKHLSQADYDGVIEAIHKAIEGKEIFNASFIPGTKWEDIPFMPLYTACGEVEEHAGFFYGILCWIAVQRHPEEWVCYKDEERNIGRGWTYFRRKKVRPLSFGK